jgi:hypothetical protein
MADIVNTLLESLMNQIRWQDELVHRWNKLLITAHAAAVAGLGFIWKTELLPPAKDVLVSILAIVTALVAVVCIVSIISELKWQGRYINYIKKLDSTGVMFSDLSVKVGGLGLQSKLYRIMLICLCILWSTVIIVQLAIFN